MDKLRLRIHIEGCSPYGFRLVGGNGKPVLVTKLRAKSRAAQAGLKDDDVILTINGHNCSDVSYERLVSLVEHSGHWLSLDINRASSNHLAIASPPPPSAVESRDWIDGNNLFSPNSSVYSDNGSMADAPFDYRLSYPTPRYPAPTAAGSLFQGRPATPVRTDSRPHHQHHQQQQRAPVSSSQRRPSLVQSNGDMVDVMWNPRDRSVTMSLQLDSAPHTLCPPPPARRHRNDAFIIINSPPAIHRTTLQHDIRTPSPARPASTQPVLSTWGSPIPSPILPLPPTTTANLPAHVIKIITPSTAPDNFDMSPPPSRKKKLYSDSAFFDDPTHNYPTVEEQIKMARHVARSLTSPANQSARGQKMFLQRKSKSAEWSPVSDSAPRRGFNTHTVATDSGRWPGGAGLATVDQPETLHYFNSPFIPSAEHADMTEAMSADELERLQLFDEESTRVTLSPQICFNVARDLHRLNDRGGRMFAKRRATAEQSTVDNSQQQQQQQQVKQRLIDGFTAAQQAARQQSTVQPTSSSITSPAANRLQELVDSQRARMTPWEAAVTYGNVDPAFEHWNNHLTANAAVY